MFFWILLLLFLYPIVRYFVKQFYLHCPQCGTKHNKFMDCESKHTVEEKNSFWENQFGIHNNKFQVADYVMKCKKCGHRWKQRSWEIY